MDFKFGKVLSQDAPGGIFGINFYFAVLSRYKNIHIIGFSIIYFKN